MPLFFVISGLLFSLKISWKVLLKKKLPRLMIPYVVFSLLTIGLRLTFSAYTNSRPPSIGEAIINLLTGGYYWFLYALLAIMLLCRSCCNKMLIVIVALLFVILNVTDQVPFVILYRITRFFPFFTVGLLLKAYYPLVCQYNILRLGVIGGFSLALYSLAFLPNVHYYYNMLVENYLVPMFGCVGFWTLSLFLSKCGMKVSSLISFFGRYSLQYYLNHLLIMLPCYYVVKFVNITSPLLQWFHIFVLGVLGATIMLIVEKKIVVINYLCGLSKT